MMQTFSLDYFISVTHHHPSLEDIFASLFISTGNGDVISILLFMYFTDIFWGSSSVVQLVDSQFERLTTPAQSDVLKYIWRRLKPPGGSQNSDKEVVRCFQMSEDYKGFFE